MKDFITLIVVLFGMVANTFLVVYGAVTDNQALLATGMTVIGGAFGAVITHYYQQVKISNLVKLLKEYKQRLGE